MRFLCLALLLIVASCGTGKDIQPQSGSNGGGGSVFTDDPNPYNLPIPTTAGANPTFTFVKNNILGPRCNSCHSGGFEPNVTTYANLMASGSVVPSTPLKSRIYIDTSLGSMPPSGGKLSNSDLANLYTWIANGALNN